MTVNIVGGIGGGIYEYLGELPKKKLYNDYNYFKELSKRRK